MVRSVQKKQDSSPVEQVEGLLEKWEEEDRKIQQEREREKERIAEGIEERLEVLSEEMERLILTCAKRDLPVDWRVYVRSLVDKAGPFMKMELVSSTQEPKRNGRRRASGGRSQHWREGKTNNLTTAIFSVLTGSPPLTVNEIVTKIQQTGQMLPNPDSDEKDLIQSIRNVVTAQKKAGTLETPKRGQIAISEEKPRPEEQ